MKPKRYEPAEAILRKHKRDPVRDLLDDVAAAVEAAERPGDIAAIRRAANEAARSLSLDGTDSLRFDQGLARLTDPQAAEPPYKLWSDKHQNVVSVDDLAAEDPRLAKAVAAIRGAGTADEAYALLRATRAAVSTWGLDHDDAMVRVGLLDGLFELEVEDDGTTTGDRPTVESVNAELDADIAASLPAPEASDDLWDRITRLSAETESVDA